MLIIAAIFLCAIISGCAGSSSERSGVPESVVLLTEVCNSFSQMHESVSFEVEHNVDMDAHIDTVTLTMISETDYATLKETAILQYQYTKSDDVWHLIGTNSDNPYPDITLNADNLISHSPWQGETNNYYSGNPNYSYILYIEDVDTDAQTMLVSYEIDYVKDEYPDYIVEHRYVRYEHVIGNDYYTLSVDPDGNWLEYLQIFTVGCNGIEAYDY